MKKLAALTLSLFLVTGTALADTPKDSDPQTGKPAPAARPKAAAKKVDKSAELAAQLEELRKSLQSQQEQLSQLKNELAKRDQQIEEARAAAAAANQKASDAASSASGAAASAAEAKTAATAVTSDVNDMKLGSESLKVAVQDTQKKIIAATESPSTLHFKGINLTPGGFLAAETVFRNRAASADINTPFTGIPYPGNALSKVTENNFTARQTRATLLAESKVGSAKVTEYLEMDFLGAGTTSNNRQSNSYVFRQRQLWANATFDNGWSVTGGQQWSLATENRKGIQNRGEALPMMIDPQYVVGFTWQRAYQFRVVKDFGGKFAIGVSIEGPQTTIGGRGFSTFTPATGNATQNFFTNAPGAGGGLFNAFDPTGYSVNKAPDFLFKIAADPGFGHYELFGIVSAFRARIYPCAVVSPLTTNAAGTVILNGPALTGTSAGITCANTAPSAVSAFNDSRTAGGGGASAHFQLFAKKVDFGLKAVAGDGIGRFGSAQLADVTARPDGTLAPIRTAHGLGILELHPNAKLDIYLYGGTEYAARAAYSGYQTDAVTTSQIITACTVNATTCPQGFNLTTITTHTTSKSKIGGYGSPFANNTGCSTETAPVNQLTPGGGGTCAGDIRAITEGTLGFWHKLYQGPKGGVRWGIAYSYITKIGWSGNNNVLTSAAGIQPKAVDNMVWTSFRYYLP